MFSLGSGCEKASGPNGFIAFFFKKAWPIVGSDVINVVQYFFQLGILSEVNSTIITLVPKTNHQSHRLQAHCLLQCSL